MLGKTKHLRYPKLNQGVTRSILAVLLYLKAKKSHPNQNTQTVTESSIFFYYSQEKKSSSNEIILEFTETVLPHSKILNKQVLLKTSFFFFPVRMTIFALQ